MNKRIIIVSGVVAAAAVMLLFVLLLVSLLGGFTTIRKEGFVTQKPDGGASVLIIGRIRYWMLMSPEGPFPEQNIFVEIELVGPGKDVKNEMGMDGYYYAPDVVKCNFSNSIGYAYMDRKRSRVYLNFYRADSPNSVRTIDEITGCYYTNASGQ